MCIYIECGYHMLGQKKTKCTKQVKDLNIYIYKLQSVQLLTSGRGED